MKEHFVATKAGTVVQLRSVPANIVPVALLDGVPAQLTATSVQAGETYQAPTRTQIPSTCSSLCITYLAPIGELRELGKALSTA